MEGLTCARCAFRNEAGAGACLACGNPLAADPGAHTTLLPSVVSCWNCSAANESGRAFCKSCGQQLHAATQAWPTVAPPAAQPPPAAAPPAEPPAPSQLRRPRTRRGGRRRPWLPVVGAALVGALLVAATFVVAGLIGQRDGGLGGLFGAGRSPAAGSPAMSSPAGRATAGTTEGDGDPAQTPGGGAGFDCATQSTTASEPGEWTVVRARWGRRSAFDYISFVLRRGGTADEAVTATAELLPADQVEARFGIDPPAAGENAIVITFAPPAGLSGAFGRSTDLRALRNFRLERGDGAVYAVVGVTGPGCFQLAAPDWDDGSPRNVELTVQIERG